MSTRHYVACDLGAESGRVMLGTLTDGKLTLEEIHRFPNGPVRVNGTLRWDVLRIFEELQTGLGKLAARRLKIESVSCDSWGVDYVWLRGNEPLLTAPFHYRDARTDGGFERAFALVPREKIFAKTGIQFMTLNTLYQLHADVQQRPWIVETADRFLNIGDYFNYLFCGVAKAEVSLASTTQLYNPLKKRWAKPLLKKLGLKPRLFPEIVRSGTVLGPLHKDFGLPGTKVVATCSHDTGAAVAAVPATGRGWAYLSSGTWSLLGIETKQPIITSQSLDLNFTNEVGYGHSIRFLKNIIGLWVVQECRRAWAAQGQEYSYAELTDLARTAAPLKCLINPAAEPFAKPGDMPAKIAAYCRQTNQPEPATPGEFVRATLESLALLYRKTIADIVTITGQPIQRLHIVGGGTKNTLLNQLAANATGIPVLAGPAECTAIGNILIQALALRHLPSLAALRRVVADSFPVERYEPQDADTWAAAAERFDQLVTHS